MGIGYWPNVYLRLALISWLRRLRRCPISAASGRGAFTSNVQQDLCPRRRVRQPRRSAPARPVDWPTARTTSPAGAGPPRQAGAAARRHAGPSMAEPDHGQARSGSVSASKTACGGAGWLRTRRPACITATSLRAEPTYVPILGDDGTGRHGDRDLVPRRSGLRWPGPKRPTVDVIRAVHVIRGDASAACRTPRAS